METAFSQLTVVLGFGLTHARGPQEGVNRAASKILAHTFCFLWHRLHPAWETRSTRMKSLWTKYQGARIMSQVDRS